MTQIGPYVIIERLTPGAMGDVYKAHQPSLKRMIFLKLLPSERESDETAVRRFRQEGETAARLRHDNIVTVYDAHVDEPPYYIAMEFLEGRPLSDLLAERGCLTPEEAISIVRQIALALDHAHSKGIIHRDVKPANIMIDANGRATLTDFGIAKATDQTRLTMDGARFGTPDFMSPEQAKGLRVDHRTDLYSLGAVLYYAVTGQPPFVADDPLAVMHKIINEDPVPPGHLNPQVSPALEQVILVALQKAPAARYQSGADFASALDVAVVQHYAAPAPVTPARISAPTIPVGASDAGWQSTATPRLIPAEGVVTTERRSRLLPAIGLAVILGLMALVMIMWHPWSPGTGKPPTGPTAPRKTAVVPKGPTAKGVNPRAPAPVPKSPTPTPRRIPAATPSATARVRMTTLKPVAAKSAGATPSPQGRRASGGSARSTSTSTGAAAGPPAHTGSGSSPSSMQRAREDERQPPPPTPSTPSSGGKQDEPEVEKPPSG